MSDVVNDLMNTIDEMNIRNNDLEKENAELRDLVFKSWISQTERYNPDISQDIKTQWDSSYMYKLLKEQGE